MSKPSARTNIDEDPAKTRLSFFRYFIHMGDYAYGLAEIPQIRASTGSSDSIQSAYEAEEIISTLNSSNKTVFESNSLIYERPESVTSNEDFASILSDSSDLPLSSIDDLNTVPTDEEKSTSSWEPQTPLNSDIGSTAKLLRVGSSDDDQIAQIVHDLVFKRYEDSYNRLLKKLKKIRLTEEENKYRNVIDELQSVIKEQNSIRKDVELPTASDNQEICHEEAAITVYKRGLADIPQIRTSTGSSESVQSAYEAEEKLNTLNSSNNTVFECNSLIYERPGSVTSNEDIASILSGSSDLLLSSIDDLNTVPTEEAKSASSRVPQAPLNSDLGSTAKQLIVGSSKDNQIAQIVHDLVFKRYEDSYNRLLKKLKKIRLTEEENKYRNVIDELQSVIKKDNSFRNDEELATESDNQEICHKEAAIPVYKRGNRVYSSTDSEYDSDVKPIGIPLSSSMLYDEPDVHEFKPISELIIHDAKPMKYFPNDICPNVDVEAQVFTCSIEDINLNNNCELNHEASTSKFIRSQNKLINLPNAVKSVKRSKKIDYKPSSEDLSSIGSSSDRSKYSNEYNELVFLKTALGDDLENTSSKEYVFQHSIGTEDISYLISSTSTVNDNRTRRCRKNYPILNNSLHQNTPHSKNAKRSGPSTYPSYEAITNYSQVVSADKRKKDIKNKMFIHESIMNQAENALKYGKQKPHGFIGSPAHLEIERILLVSKIRRQALMHILYSLPEVSEAVGQIKIENVKCVSSSMRNHYHASAQYYVCVLQYKSTVYITKIASPNRLGLVNFGGTFTFDDVPNTFNIKVELYAVFIPKSSRKCYRLPFMRSTSKLPMLKLVGMTNIGIINHKNERFSLICNEDQLMEAKLSATISTTIKWPEKLRGFLNVGIEKYDHPPIWNRRWCLLENGKLHYYNYPSDEDYCKPVGSLNLDSCKWCEESTKKYLWQHTLALFTNNGEEFKTYYLSPDTIEEFTTWQKYIEIILKLTKQWNMF